MMTFPKTDLHLHLDGSVRPATAWELAQQQKLTLKNCASLEECEERMRVRSDSASLSDYFRAFEVPSAVLRTEEALSRVTAELIEDLERDGVRYAEIRFAPQLHKPLTQQQAVQAVLDGCERGMQAHPSVKAGVILCAMSFGDPAANRQDNWETLELCSAFKGKTAFDLAGHEIGLEAFEDLYREAARRQIPFTVHAGEVLDAANVEKALNFGARRIGHGIHAAADDRVVAMLKECGATLEVSVKSNVQTMAVPSYEAHPIRALFDVGVRVTVCTDNRTCSHTTLEQEYDTLRRYYGFQAEELRQMNRYGLEAAFFLTECEKSLLIDALK